MSSNAGSQSNAGFTFNTPFGIGRVLAIAVLAALLFIAGCSKKGESAVAGTILNKLPQDTIGFLIWDNAGEAGRRYTASPWGSASTSFGGTPEELQNLPLPEADRQLFIALMEGLQEAGIISKDGKSTGVVAQSVYFVTAGANAPEVGFGLYLTPHSGKSVGDLSKTLAGAFTKSGRTPTTQAFGATQGYSVSIETSAPTETVDGEAAVAPADPTPIFFASDAELFVAGSSANLVEHGFSKAGAESKPPAILETASYKRAREIFAKSSGEFATGFLDIEGIKRIIRAAAPTQVDDFPFESLAVSIAMDDAPSLDLRLNVSKEPGKAAKWTAPTDDSKSNALFGRIPQDTIGALGLDTRVLLTMLEQSAEVGAELQGLPPEVLENVRSLQSIVLTVRSASPGSPFPDIALQAESNRGAEAVESIRAVLQENLGSSGLPISEWQEKEIAGHKAQFVLSPLGIGLYITATPTTLVLSTSEGGIQAAIEASKGDTKSLVASLPKALQGLQLAPAPVLAVYSNLVRAADLAQSLEANLAMFTGGQPVFPDDKVKMLRELGQFSMAAGVDPNGVIVRGRYAKVG